MRKVPGILIGMKKTICAAALLSAFAAAQAEPLTCADAKACERMWSDAQEAVGIVSDMRIRLLTHDRIETFPPMRVSSVGAIVTKTPEGDGYRIHLRLECRGRDGCEPSLREKGQKLFEKLLMR